MKTVAKPVIDIDSLTPEERLELIEDLWESLDALPLGLSEEQSKELARRVERVRQHGPSGLTISEIREQLVGGLPLSDEWEAEIQRRIDDVDSGRMQTVPGDEVFSRIEQRLRGR
jgi:putative addiction module component (TIGR02574 family)